MEIESYNTQLPQQQHHQSQDTCVVYDGLSIFPDEVKLLILMYLDVEDLSMLYGVSYEFRRLCSDEILWRKLVTPRFKFDPNNKGRYLNLSEDGLTAKFIHTEDQWNTACTTYGYSKGVHYWEIAVENFKDGPNTWRLCVGVLPEGTDCSKQTRVVSWSFIAGSGKKVSNNAQFGKTYGDPYGKGDTVGVLLDMDEKKMHFFVNDKPQGLAFSNLAGTVYPTISMYLNEIQVSHKAEPERVLRRVYGYRMAQLDKTERDQSQGSVPMSLSSTHSSTANSSNTQATTEPIEGSKVCNTPMQIEENNSATEKTSISEIYIRNFCLCGLSPSC